MDCTILGDFADISYLCLLIYVWGHLVIVLETPLESSVNCSALYLGDLHLKGSAQITKKNIQIKE